MGEQVERPYVPVLRAKQGEFGAVKALADDVKPFVHPLFELTPPSIRTRTTRNQDGRRTKTRSPKELGAHLTDLANAIADASVGLTEVWVDDQVARPPLVPAAGKHPLAHFFSALDTPPCPVVPVVGLHRDSAYTKAAYEQADKVGRLVIRVKPGELADSRAADRSLRRVLTEAGLKRSQAHLVLDIDPFSPGHVDLVLIGVAAVLVNVPHPEEWTTFTVTTTALPDKTFDRVDNDSEVSFERACWSMWKSLQSTKAPRLPGFGDYGIDNPETDLDQPFFNTPIPMIRYTTPDHWVFFRGTGKSNGAAKRKTDWPELAARLIASGHFRGRDFSAGDEFIQECADGAPKHSGGTQWRLAGVNHHITQVVEQLTNLP